MLYDIYNEYGGINNIKTANDNAGRLPSVDGKIIVFWVALTTYEATGCQINVAWAGAGMA